MTELPEYTLDVSKWRCGGSSLRSFSRLGKGHTRMLNDEGYMCCLGQFAEQAGVSHQDLLNTRDPAGITRKQKTKSYDPLFAHDFSLVLVALEGNFNNNTALTETLMEINDDTETTPQEKIKLISEEFKSRGLKLVVIDEQGILEDS